MVSLSTAHRYPPEPTRSRPHRLRWSAVGQALRRTSRDQCRSRRPSDTVNLGPWAGSLATGTGPLDPSNVATFTGYTGPITVTANGDNTDAIAFNGTAGNVVQVSATPSTISTDQNTAVSARVNLATSLTGTYTLSAAAPKGWGVAVDGTGKLTIIPGPGVQSGTYPILVVAQSSANSGLVAQTIVNVTITPTQPGMTLIVAPDPLFTVPFDGAELPTAFRATIQNLGPAADTYNLTFSNLPSGFTLLNSETSVTVPAGQTGFLGLYLQPNPGQPIPPVGSQVSFTVTATSTTDPTLTKTQTVTFTMPAIDGVTATVSSSAVTSTSGGSATTILTLTNVGNVAETVTPTATLPSGVTASGLTAATLPTRSIHDRDHHAHARFHGRSQHADGCHHHGDLWSSFGSIDDNRDTQPGRPVRSGRRGPASGERRKQPSE